MKACRNTPLKVQGRIESFSKGGGVGVATTLGLQNQIWNLVTSKMLHFEN